MPALGGGERLVAAKGRRPRFSPDGKSIAYVTGGRGASTDVWIVDDGGASPRRLEVLEFDVRDSVAPVWSPDGAFLAVAAIRRVRGAAAINDWWLINVQSGAATAMSTAGPFERAGLSSNTGPAAWVNGEILFSATAGDVSSLWAIALSSDGRTVTGVPRRLTAGVVMDGEPSVARGANDRTVYYANKDERANVYRLQLTGLQRAANLERVTDAAASDLWPSVSVDGQTLVFGSNRSSDWGAWSRDLASGRETPLTSTGGGMATISPDGRRVSYSASPQLPWIFVTRPVGGGATEPLPGDLAYVWSWPSQTVLFGSGPFGDIADLRVVDLASGNVRPALAGLKQVSTDMASCRPMAAGRARWSGRARTGRASSFSRSAPRPCRLPTGSRSRRISRSKKSTCGRRRVTPSTLCRSATAVGACGCGNSIPRPGTPLAP